MCVKKKYIYLKKYIIITVIKKLSDYFYYNLLTNDLQISLLFMK